MFFDLNRVSIYFRHIFKKCKRLLLNLMGLNDYIQPMKTSSTINQSKRRVIIGFSELQSYF